jgi:alanine dehydrogenase
VPGAAAPKLVTRAMVQRMRSGSVLVDIAIDQGGCFETSRPTTHSAPTYVVEGVVHYCVTNMPGAVAKTSTYALTNATLPFVLALAGKGWRQAMLDDPHLAEGLNIDAGRVTHRAVAQALGLRFTPPRVDQTDRRQWSSAHWGLAKVNSNDKPIAIGLFLERFHQPRQREQ